MLNVIVFQPSDFYIGNDDVIYREIIESQFKTGKKNSNNQNRWGYNIFNTCKMEDMEEEDYDSESRR